MQVLIEAAVENVGLFTTIIFGGLILWHKRPVKRKPTWNNLYIKVPNTQKNRGGW
jgi:hypothetical protein